MGKIGRFMKAVGQGMGAAWTRFDRATRKFLIVILSVALTLVYLLGLCIGVVRQSPLAIIFCGLVLSLYFAGVVFFALERPLVFRGLITWLGFTLVGGKWSAEDKKRVRCLWFLAVAPLFFTFWLAMFPTKTMGIIAIVAASCLLTLLIIAHWQEIPSTFWKAYYNFAKWAFPITIALVFLVYAPFAAFWNSAGKLAVEKSEQAARWMFSPSKTEKRAVRKRAPARKMAGKVAPRLESKAERVEPVDVPPKHAEKRAAAATDDNDDVAEAAEAGLAAFDQMRKELAELSAREVPRKNQFAPRIKTPAWAE